MKQCNQVLNGLFSDTVVDSDSNDTQGNAFVDDEAESNMQVITRKKEGYYLYISISLY